MGDHTRPPTDEQIKLTTEYDVPNKCIKVIVSVDKPGWIIKSLMAMSEAMFEGGIHVIQPFGSAQASNQLSIGVKHPKFTDEKVDFKIMMGAGANAPHFLIHEASLKFKRFDFMMPLATEELIFGYPQTHMSGVVTG